MKNNFHELFVKAFKNIKNVVRKLSLEQFMHNWGAKKAIVRLQMHFGRILRFSLQELLFKTQKIRKCLYSYLTFDPPNGS